ncbi:MAG: coenzyme A pyrophosphatase [Clostridiales bacterium]|nr:MAG: coenzyme A pyrophosphatase [Clostridiales bacterium]
MRIDYFAEHKPKIIDISREYGILIPLVEIDRQWHLLFETRSKLMRRQPGEVCFPGGRVEPNESCKDAAIRECCEELGITKKNIALIGPMDSFISSAGDHLCPYVAKLRDVDPDSLNINKDEVDSVFLVPIEHLKAQRPESYRVETKLIPRQDFPYHKIGETQTYNWRGRDYVVLFYYFKDKVIWGMTAKLVERLLHYL